VLINPSAFNETGFKIVIYFYVDKVRLNIIDTAQQSSKSLLPFAIKSGGGQPKSTRFNGGPFLQKKSQ